MTHAHLPVLYSFRRCPYAMRARLALAVSGTSCRLREVVLRDKPQALLDASPKATVPVVVLPDGRVIDESLDIMLWALHQRDPEAWLQPSADTLSGMLDLIAQNDGPFKAHLDRYKYPGRFELESGQPHREAACEWLASLDSRLSDHDGWLSGANRSLADMAIAPFVRQFAHTDRDWFKAQPWPALQHWLATFLDSPLFVGIMKKHPPWQPGQAELIFP